MEIPTPSGYTLQGRWVSAQCTQRLLTSSQINDCLKGKLIYLLGDSTLRQWIEYLPKVAKTLRPFDLHGTGLYKKHLILDAERHTLVEWKMHEAGVQPSAPHKQGTVARACNSKTREDQK